MIGRQYARVMHILLERDTNVLIKNKGDKVQIELTIEDATLLLKQLRLHYKKNTLDIDRRKMMDEFIPALESAMSKADMHRVSALIARARHVGVHRPQKQ